MFGLYEQIPTQYAAGAKISKPARRRRQKKRNQSAAGAKFPRSRAFRARDFSSENWFSAIQNAKIFLGAFGAGIKYIYI
jgi:hypothetical protein